MRLSVWKIGKWKWSKYEEGNNLVVVFKGIDSDNLGVTYKLNLNSLQPTKHAWLRVLVEGNVLEDIWVLPGSKTINKNHVPRISSHAVGKQAVDEDGNLPEQLELPMP